MQGIFISYRRQDSQSAAGRLADDIKDCLPGVAVFRDVETIEPGMDFSEAINRALQSCDVLLAVIGPRWLSAVDDDGKRRLDSADDYTRIEIATGLKRSDVRVIPILVEGAQMPEAEDLPEELKPLARRNALELTDGRWRYDVSRLAETVAVALGTPANTTAQGWPPSPGSKPDRAGIGLGGIALGAVVGVLIAAAIGYGLWRAQTPDASVVDPSQMSGSNANVVADSEPESPQMALAVDGSAPVEPCPKYLGINRALPTPFTCGCDAAAVQRGTVWGSDLYTDDSSLCRAAAHAGVIPATGGAVTVTREAGRPLYVGSARNGIETNDYGDFSPSIRFVGAAILTAGPQPCPKYLGINRNLPTPFSCRCDAAAIQRGTVWGSDVYTDDSALCRAAAHAGVIPSTGGAVTVTREAGRPLYVGSVRNGIETNDYGDFSHSIRFQMR